MTYDDWGCNKWEPTLLIDKYRPKRFRNKRYQTTDAYSENARNHREYSKL